MIPVEATPRKSTYKTIWDKEATFPTLSYYQWRSKDANMSIQFNNDQV